MSRLYLVLLLLAAFPSKGIANDVPDHRRSQPVFALVVGNNQAIEGHSNLRYADDDAVQNALFMTQIGDAANVRLLTSLDEDTQAIYPGLHPGIPSKKNIQTEMDLLNRRMLAEKQKGKKPEFYLFYTGHGNVKNNTGYIAMTDGRFTRYDLLALVGKSEAWRNHLIIDACKSYFMVYDRGPGGSRRKVTGILESNDELPSNTGVFLSTSSAASSHEWEAISAGVFSHEVRSALRGGADLDLNQKITYEEAAAFIWSANRGIPVKKFRPAFYMQPPGGESASDTVLADLTVAHGHWLHATPAKDARQFIEDARGYRVAEFHPGDARNLAILIPEERPLFVRSPGDSIEYQIPPLARVELTSLAATKGEVVQRGAENHAFQQLFAAPFGIGGLADYLSMRNQGSNEWVDGAPDAAVAPLRDGHRQSQWARRFVGLSSVLLAGSGLTMTMLALKKHNDASTGASNQEAVLRNSAIHRLNTGAITCYVLAGVAFTTWLIWTLVARKGARVRHAGWSVRGLNLGRRF